VKTSQHQKLVDEFMSFILSNDFQSVIPTGNWMYPVTNTELPEGFDSLSVPQKSLTFTADEVAKERKVWVREWQNALTF